MCRAAEETVVSVETWSWAMLGHSVSYAFKQHQQSYAPHAYASTPATKLCGSPLQGCLAPAGIRIAVSVHGAPHVWGARGATDTTNRHNEKLEFSLFCTSQSFAKPLSMARQTKQAASIQSKQERCLLLWPGRSQRAPGRSVYHRQSDGRCSAVRAARHGWRSAVAFFAVQLHIARLELCTGALLALSCTI